MSGFSRRVETPGSKKKAAKKRTERPPEVEKKPKGKKALKKTRVDSGTSAAQGREPKTLQKAATGLDTRDGREG